MTNYHATVNRIKALLDQHGAEYKCFEHAAVRTSEEAAAIRPEYSLAQGAKALIVQVKRKGLPKDECKQFVQLVVPGDAKFDAKKVRNQLDVKDVRFATPEEVAQITDGIVPGGVPPFGILWDVPVYADSTLLDNDEIIFNAGDKRFSIALKTTDYTRVVNPNVVAVT